MNLHYHSVVLFVTDIDKAKHFYHKVLNIPIDMDMGSNVILKNGITLWQLDPHHIIPQQVGLDTIQHKGHGFELYFETDDDIPSTHEALHAHQVAFIHELHEEPWGQRTIRLYDPDNNILEIGETLKTFLLRMKAEGLTMEQLKRKTGMKEEDIQRAISPQSDAP
jgi:catechol 2,3-dioxygenase-like lactoylglutathione lyase family enzyme